MLPFFLLLLLFCFFSPCTAQVSAALNAITTNQSIRTGGSMVSAGGTFELGYFSSGDPPRWYLGIWYRKIPTRTIVWVANRVVPLTDSSGTFKVTSQGRLVLFDRNGSEIWSSNSSTMLLQNPIAQLLDSGNLVVRDLDGKDPNNFAWQSFDYPTDTFLPGMKLGRNRTAHFDWYLTSSKSIDDPSPGNFTYRLDINGYPQLLLMQGSLIKFRTGPWNGVRWSGTPHLSPNPYYKYEFVLNEEEIYYGYELLSSSIISRKVLVWNGIVQRLTWIDRTKGWHLYHSAPTDNCDTYALCGSHGSCNVDASPACRCLKGFMPKIPQEWDSLDWSNGCVRRASLDCGSDIFVKYPGVKFPDTRESWFNTSMNLEECRVVCKENCSCVAYSNLDIRAGGSGCLLWFGDLIDIREYNENGQDLYIRMAASESGLIPLTQKKHKKLVVGLALPFLGFLIIVALGLFVYILRNNNKKRSEGQRDNAEIGDHSKGQNEDLDLPVFDFVTVATATDNFSIDNKLGEGGYGPVYKGVLKNGQEIAVKKLSSGSKQGLDEFKNEVLHISKLQHRNLVKLLGCCVQDENLLIYEYMPNKSLDSFLFDEKQNERLDWLSRFHIINGIARGLLYLHQDSRLRIVHRDLKASNILLDHEMNPKISDFGLAKSFVGNETEANTNRVVGTYGYMSPEYITDGVFSTSSDVFSYGVLVLEIVSGKRNRGFHHPDHHHNLLGHAWTLFVEGRSTEFLDESVGNSCNPCQVLRCIQVGLLCVQRCAEERPSMSKVVLMLESEGELAPPREPGFFIERELLPGPTFSPQELCSPNGMTITELSAR